MDERHEINKDLSEYLINARITESGYKDSETKIDSIKKLLLNLDTAKDYDRIEQLIPLLHFLADKYEEYGKNWRSEIPLGKKLLARLEYNEKEQTVDKLQGEVLLYIGGVLMFYGFLLWYRKHQRYIDAETRYNGEKFIKLLKKQDALKKKEQVQDTSSEQEDNKV